MYSRCKRLLWANGQDTPSWPVGSHNGPNLWLPSIQCYKQVAKTGSQKQLHCQGWEATVSDIMAPELSLD
jgi:hypothetical protein